MQQIPRGNYRDQVDDARDYLEDTLQVGNRYAVETEDGHRFSVVDTLMGDGENFAMFNSVPEADAFAANLNSMWRLALLSAMTHTIVDRIPNT